MTMLILCPGSVNISCTLSGSLLGKLSAAGKHAGTPEFQSLDGVTALFYQEDCNEMFVGTANGIMSRWRG